MFKTLKFFRKNPNFKEAKVLLTHTFIEFMIDFKRNEHHFKKILGKATLFATRCTLNEVDFGSELQHQVLDRLKIKVTGCRHRGSCEERECLESVLLNGNGDGFFVAAETETEIERLQRMENVPVLCRDGRNIVLRKASDLQQQLAAEVAQAHGRHGGRHGGVGRDFRAGGRAN